MQIKIDSVLSSLFKETQATDKYDESKVVDDDFIIVNHTNDEAKVVDDDFLIVNHPAEAIGKPRHLEEIQKYCYGTMLPIIANAQMAGHITLSLGGDRSIALGTLAATRDANNQQPVNTICISAKTGAKSSFESKLGNVREMPIALAANRGDIELKNGGLIYLGLRDLEKSEKNFIEYNDIPVYDPQKIKTLGGQRVAEEIFEKIGEKPLNVSFDVSAMDPTEVPDTGAPVKGGIHLQEMKDFFLHLGQKCNICSVEVVELNPGLGRTRDNTLPIDNASAKKVVNAVASLIEGVKLNNLTRDKGLVMFGLQENRGQSFPGVARASDVLVSEGGLRENLWTLGYNPLYVSLPVNRPPRTMEEKKHGEGRKEIKGVAR